MAVRTVTEKKRTAKRLGSAAKGAAKAARKLGYAAAAKAESFYVGDVKGPLLDGELDRAQSWGEELGAQAAARAVGRARS